MSNIMQIGPKAWARPPAPEPCDCQPDCGPGWPGWPPPPFPAFMECWQQVAQFKAMVQQIVSEMPSASLINSPQFKAAVQQILDDLGIVPGPSGGGTIVSITPPANPSAGATWWDGQTLRVWDGKAWVPESQTKNYVQVSAPTSPNPGDQWWNGTQQRIWDGTSWQLVGPSAGTGPGTGVSATTHVFSMLLGADSLSTTSGFSIIPFVVAPALDTQGMWQSTTQQIRPNSAGNYLVFITGWGVYGSGQNEIYMLKNDPGTVTTNSLNTQMSIAEAGGNAQQAGIGLSGSGMVHMNGTTDYLRFWAFLTGGTFYPFSQQVPVIDIWQMP